VLERADTMNDEAANSLLKTLEEPPAYVVLLLLTDRPTQVLETVASRCQPVRFDPMPPAALAQQLQAEGAPADAADACARLSLGDGERARALAFGDGPELRAAAEAFARAALEGTSGTQRPWRALLERAYAAGQRARRDVEAALAEELEFVPKKEHRRLNTEFSERARRAERRAETGALDHALQLAGLYYRDLACLATGAPELVFNTDRDLQPSAAAPALLKAQELVDDTRARLPLNVAYELALEALAYRLEAELSSSSSA
jgi:DNA polymerase-3 subunit delta'